MNHEQIRKKLNAALAPLVFSLPVTHVYNPLEYAAEPYRMYHERYGRPEKEILLLGMNPGPWGMAQTGVPFGDAEMVSRWLGIHANVQGPPDAHPKRMIEGFACPRSEVSGTRLWGWAQSRFGTAERFFKRFFVANYCPLMFLEESGRNRTPDKLRATERRPLLEACNSALRRTTKYLAPRFVIGIGAFAANRAADALDGLDITIGRITHPSPANPKANKGWATIVEAELSAMGIAL